MNNKEIIILADTTYYGKGFEFGVVVFKDSISGKFIYRKESINDYLQGLEFLRNQGYKLKAFVCDGFRGLAKSVYPLPFQLCQFHIQKYVKAKLTNNPKTEAGAKLLQISKALTYTTCTEFKMLLNNFEAEFKDFLNEKTINENGKSFYTHKCLRSAYFSLTQLKFTLYLREFSARAKYKQCARELFLI